jgi:hypothetical protein
MDVAFIVDTTSSMGGAIDSVKAGLTSILNDIESASGNDYRLALVTFKDTVAVGVTFAPQNKDNVAAAINALTVSGGNNIPEASDEALNTVVNALPARPGQVGDFTPAFRDGALKIIILITDAEPGGFDDTFTPGVDDVNAHARAVEAAGNGILISAVIIGSNGLAQTIMQDYADTTGGRLVDGGSTGAGTGAAIVDIIAACGGGGGCTVTCPPDITQSQDPGQCDAVVNYTVPTVPVSCGPVTCVPPPGTRFPVGTTTVNCSLPDAPDDGPPAGSCSFTVTIIDTEPLRFTCPLETRVDCSGIVNYDLPTATGSCAGLQITCFPPPGTSFPTGSTVVNCSATEENGNTAHCTFRIVVADSTAPTITSCPAAPIALANPTGACTVALGNVTGSVAGTDSCSPGSITKTQAPAAGTLLAAGQTHAVTVFVSDAAGNSSQCVVMVTVGPPGAPTAVISPSDGTLNLGSVSLFGNQKKKKKKVKQAVVTGSFTVRNQGCGNLVLSRRSLLRQIGNVAKNEDDDILSITVDGQEFTTVQIAPDETKTFNVRFSPVIPGLSSCPAGSNLASCLSASDVVPNDYRAVLSFNETSSTVTINATVTRGMKLIDPNNPTSTNPVVTLCRSGDQFTVTYYLYSSDLSDVRSVKYEFMDNSGSVVDTVDGVDLAGPISRAGLINGMSFKVTHSFTGAEDNSDVTRVKVTVTGGSSQASATSSSAGSSCGASAQSFGSLNGVTLALPARRLKGFEN